MRLQSSPSPQVQREVHITVTIQQYIISMTVCMHCVCVYIIMCNHHSALYSTYVYGLWTGGLLVMCMALYSVLHGAFFLFSIHLNQQVETSTEEDPDSDSLTPITLPYPHLIENCFAPSVFVHGRLEYECPSLSACPLHQDVSPHTHNWHCVVSGKTIK